VLIDYQKSSTVKHNKFLKIMHN